MKFGFRRYAFALVVVTVVGLTLFRVATAPERIKERLKTAQSVCAATGGTWTTVDMRPVCVKP
jgi:hypothetical protein